METDISFDITLSGRHVMLYVNLAPHGRYRGEFEARDYDTDEVLDLSENDHDKANSAIVQFLKHHGESDTWDFDERS